MLCYVLFHFCSLQQQVNELHIKILSKYLPSTPAAPRWPLLDWNTSRCAGWHSRRGLERCWGWIGERGREETLQHSSLSDSAVDPRAACPAMILSSLLDRAD